MDEGKILIVNFSKGKIGEDASRLLGAFLITKIQLAAMSRVDTPEAERRDFYLYVDEFQNFATESFANILSEARKYHLSLVMAHQYIKQMEEPVMDAVFGNVGTIVAFRVGAEDAEYLEKWFQPDFMMNDIVNLGKRDMYLKLMINGVSSKGFSAGTLDRFPKLENSNREAIISASRETYTTQKNIVEKEIAEWAGPIAEEGSFARPTPERRRDDRPFDRPQARPYNSSQSRPSIPRRDDRPSYGPPRREERPYPRKEESKPQPSRQEKPFNQVQGGPKEASLSALNSIPVDFRGRKIQDRPKNNNREKKEVDTGELKKLLEESLKKKE